MSGAGVGAGAGVGVGVGVGVGAGVGVGIIGVANKLVKGVDVHTGLVLEVGAGADDIVKVEVNGMCNT